MMDLLGATVGRAVAESCPCKTAIAFMVRLGAKHAAKMHAQGATDNPEKWPNLDWDLHEDEEEKLFFPLLTKPVARQFVAEHKIFQAERKKYGKIMSLELLRAHAARENMWAEKILADSESGARVGRSPDREVEDPKESIPASEQAKPYAGKWLSLVRYQDSKDRVWTFKVSDPPAPAGYSDWIREDGTIARIAVATPNWLGSGDYKVKIGSLFDQWIDAPKDEPDKPKDKPVELVKPVKPGFRLEPTPLTLAAGFVILLGLGFVVARFLSRRVT